MAVAPSSMFSFTEYCDVQDVLAQFPNSVAQIFPALVKKAVLDASGMVENYTQRILALQTYNEASDIIINRKRQLVGHVEQWPIQDVTALSLTLDTYNSAPNPQTLDITKVRWKVRPERLFYYTGPLYADRYCSSGVINYTYAAGYPFPYPRDIVKAAVFYTIGLLYGDANPMGATNISVSAEGSSNSVGLGKRPLWWDEADKLLNIYVRRTT